MKRIFQKVEAALLRGEDVVLCSILASSGSAPRGAGAKMAVFADGTTIGPVGGGAVEQHTQRLAMQVHESKQPVSHGFRLAPNQVNDIGMICGGNVTVYFQLLTAADLPFVQALRKLAGNIAKTNCVVIFINQLRMKIGVMYGNPETTTGGNALKFYASVRIDIRRIEAIKNGSEIIGNRTRAKIVKNKVAPPFKEAVFDIMYGEGISKWGELVDIAAQLDIIQKSGSWFSIGDERIGQGRDNAKKYLMDNPEVAERVEKEVRENMWKLQGSRAKPPAAPAAKPVAVSADDFSDET